MKKFNLKAITKSTLLGLAVLSLAIVMSCGGGGGDNGPKQSAGDKILAAIPSGAQTVPTTGIPADAAATINTATVTFSVSGQNVSFTAGGDLADFISGGSFTVEDSGSISNATVNAASGSNLTISGASATVSTTQAIVGFTAAASGREDGIGTWTMTVTF